MKFRMSDLSATDVRDRMKEGSTGKCCVFSPYSDHGLSGMICLCWYCGVPQEEHIQTWIDKSGRMYSVDAKKTGDNRMKFRKKPVVIEAEQYFRDKEPWPSGVQMGFPVVGHSQDGRAAVGEKVTVYNTFEGYMEVSEGDWIITGIKGEKYPCNAGVFAETYEKVEDR